uniref:Uncharacterized protein n=1 Tax=Oryza rufipogon TaxID=4529 RepID=A0A0E0RBR1_ORYRU
MWLKSAVSFSRTEDTAQLHEETLNPNFPFVQFSNPQPVPCARRGAVGRRAARARVGGAAAGTGSAAQRREQGKGSHQPGTEGRQSSFKKWLLVFLLSSCDIAGYSLCFIM